MPRRHPDLPTAWLLTDERVGDELWRAIRRLPRGSGVIVRHHSLPRVERRRLLRRVRQAAAARGIVVLDDGGHRVARVHDVRELRRALLSKPPLLFVSPLHPTRTHPGWAPMPRMRAAALASLSPQPVMALGGMTARRFRQIRPLGFAGYGAIDGWLRT